MRLWRRRILIPWLTLIKGRQIIIAICGTIIFGCAYYIYHLFFLAHSQLLPTSGGILTETTVGRLINLNPLAVDVSQLDRDLHSLIFAGLLRYNPASKQMENGLAELQVSDDARSYTLVLKPSAKFSNGRRVTARDVVFTFEHVIQHPNFHNEYLRRSFEYVTITATDDRTITFTLLEPNSLFTSLLQTPILPVSLLSSYLIEEITDPDIPFNQNPVGAGPYQLQNIIPNTDGSMRIFLERNPYFYLGKALIPKFVIYAYPELNHISAGVDPTILISRVPKAFLSSSFPVSVDDYHFFPFVLPQFTGVFFNLDRSLPGNLYLRKALSLAVDPTTLLHKEKQWQPIDSIFFWSGIDSFPHQQDTRQARNTLRDAGFRFNSTTGERHYGPKKKPLTLRLVTTTQPAIYSRLAQAIARIWEDTLDITVTVDIVKTKIFQQILADRDYDMVLFGQDFSTNFDMVSTWHSANSGGANLANLTRDDVDFLLKEIKLYGSGSDLFSLAKRFDDLVPALPLGTPDYSFYLSPELLGDISIPAQLSRWSDRFFGIEKWHFFTKKYWHLPDEWTLWTFIKWLFGNSSVIDSSTVEN